VTESRREEDPPDASDPEAFGERPTVAGDMVARGSKVSLREAPSDAKRGRAEEAAARADAEREMLARKRRARRMTLALAVVVLGAVVGVGLVRQSSEIARGEREHDAMRAFDAALDEAALLHRRAAAGQDVRLWDDAEAAAKRADAAAASADVPPQARERAAAFHGAFAPELSNVRAAFAADRTAYGLSAPGDEDAAIRAVGEAIARLPRQASFRSHLASIHIRRGNWRAAQSEARKAVELDPEDALGWERLAVAALGNFDFVVARDAAQRQVHLQPQNARACVTLGSACAGLEDWDGARRANADALLRSPGLDSATTNARDFEEREKKLMPLVKDVLSGRRTASAADWFAVGEILRKDCGRFADAAHAFDKWMQLDPAGASDVTHGGRYNAACFASRAAAGEGRVFPPLDDAAKAELRQKARTWFADDVAEWRRRCEAAGIVPPDEMVKTLARSKEDGDLAPIRDEEFTSKWPEDERKACAALWAEVDALLVRAPK